MRFDIVHSKSNVDDKTGVPYTCASIILVDNCTNNAIFRWILLDRITININYFMKNLFINMKVEFTNVDGNMQRRALF